jgi:hypothetical protein
MASSTYIGFRNRPISADQAISAQIAKGIRFGRNYQRQHLTLTGTYVQMISLTAGTVGNASIVGLHPGDRVVSAVCVVPVMTGGTIDVAVNGTLQGANLGGPWSVAPLTINMRGYAGPAAESPVSSRLFVQLTNTGAGTISEADYQLVVVVLR